MIDKQQFMKDLAIWARGQGKPAPKTKEGWKYMIAEFLAAQQQHPEHHEGPAWYEAPNDDEPTHLISDGATVQIADELHEGIFEDDWNHLLRQRAKASIGPNGELLDDFDTEFQLMQNTKDEAGDIAPWRNQNPPSSLDNPLGGSANVIAGADPIQVANWVGKDDGEATNVTVTLGPAGVYQALAGVPLAGKTLRAFADITFGCRGQVVTVRVDIGKGCQFTVSGSTVRVAVGSDVNNAAVTAMLSFRQVTHQVPITSTNYVGSIGGSATSSAITVPSFAKAVRVVRSVATEAFTVQFCNFSGATVYQVSVAASAEMPSTLITGEVNQITITDVTGNAATYSAIFELCL